MNTTLREKIMLEMLELLTDENYSFVEKEEAKELLEKYKDELDSRTKFKYFRGEYENILLIEAYADDCYIYTFECECDGKVTKEDTIDTVNLVSVGKYA